MAIFSQEQHTQMYLAPTFEKALEVTVGKELSADFIAFLLTVALRKTPGTVVNVDEVGYESAVGDEASLFEFSADGRQFKVLVTEV